MRKAQILKIDGINAEIMEKALWGIRNILANDKDVHQEFHMVNFREFEGNSRIIRLYYFTKSTIWKEHEQVRENINMKILKSFEELGIDRLAYTIVDLSDDRPAEYNVSNHFSK
jgi:MscS family membrane protein